MIKARRTKISNILQKSQKQKSFESSLQTLNYDLSEQTCIFHVNPLVLDRGEYIVLQLYIQPKVGLFANIQFRPQMFYLKFDFVKRPNIYNDRRIFHPNICVQTTQIYFSQLNDYNPSHTLEYILRRLKYTIIQPRMDSIPNNQINRKAAITYILSRNSYHQTMMKYIPAILDEIMMKPTNQNQLSMQQQFRQKKIIDMRSVVPHNRSDKNLEKRQSQCEGDQEIFILAKKIKHIDLTAINENKKSQNMISQ